MNRFVLLLTASVFILSLGCSKDDDDNTTPGGGNQNPSEPVGNVDVLLTLSDSSSISFEMDSARFTFQCGLEGGTEPDEAHWAIRGYALTDGTESLDIVWLNIIMDDITMVDPPFNYSGGEVFAEGFNEILRNGVEYSIVAVDYTITDYEVIDPDFETYSARASGTYSFTIQSPLGVQETVLITFDPMIQPEYGGGC